MIRFFFFVALNKTAKACITTEIFNNIQCIAGQLKVFLNHAVENICLNVSLPVSCAFFFSPFLTVIFHYRKCSIYKPDAIANRLLF